MRRGSSGNYRVSTTGGETVRAFVPAPLPPEPSLEIGPARQQLLERVQLALGRLDSVTHLLAAPDIFLYSYVRREAVLSSQIEGTQSSLSDLLLFELDETPGVPFDDVVEVSRYVAALDHGVARLAAGFPLSSRLLREMHALLLQHGRGSEKLPGEFRRSQNWIGGTRPGNAHFVPPPPQDVPECMSALERFIHSPTHLPVVVKAGLAHVQFETIHPFLDGNGRIGRLLISFILTDGGVLSQPLLYLSLYFKQHRSEYYRLLDRVRTEGDWEAWIDFFLEGVEQTATDGFRKVEQLLALFAHDRRTVEAQQPGVATLQVFESLCARPLLTVRAACRRTQLSFPTVAKSMQTLAALGIVAEITGRQRNRVFTYQRYLAVLNDDTRQPLQ